VKTEDPAIWFSFDVR